MKKQKKLRKVILKPVIVVTTFYFLSFGNACSADTKDSLSLTVNIDSVEDVLSVKNRLTKFLLTEPIRVRSVNTLVERLQADGSWSDIDYTVPGMHRNERHLKRAARLAQAWKAAGSQYTGDGQIRATALSALDYWLTKDYRNPGFSGLVGIPLHLSEVLLILEDELSTEQMEKGIAILARSELKGQKLSGQNLIWVAMINLRRGLLQNDSDVVVLALRYIEQEIKLTSLQGIQHDFSFHQHGMLYSFGYGYGTTNEVSRLGAMVAGTRFAFSPETLAVFSSYLLDGQRWMVRGKTTDYGAMGRWIARQKSDSRPLAKACLRMLSLPTGRTEEFRSLINHIDRGRPHPLVGNKHFWRSDIMAHHRKGYYASARMYSARIRNTDDPYHGEALKNHHIADGANFLLLTGEEYRGLAPVWDWQKIPGTTVVQTGEYPETIARRGTTTFVGGVSDGHYGLAAFDFARDGLNARKAWFFFDQEYVALGAGISDSGSDPVLTTINQSRLNGRVAIKQAGKPFELYKKGVHSLVDAEWVHHDKVGYIFFKPGSVMMTNRRQAGSWGSINRLRRNTLEQADVFTLWLDHGAGVKNGAYAYIVLPDASPDEAGRYAAKPGVTIVKNSPDLQAVRSDSLSVAGVAFYRPGELDLMNGLRIRVNRACLVLIRAGEREISVSVADPENEKKIVTVELNIASLEGSDVHPLPDKDGWSKMVFELPSGPWAGSTLTKHAKRL